MSISTIIQHDLASLVFTASENRPDHVDTTFIRVDLWGKEFDKPLFSNYQQAPTSKKYLKAVAKASSLNLNELVIKPGRGNKSGVWVHPLIASHYASWLNADFAVIVNETFRKFLDADVSIALSVIDQNCNFCRKI
jgi:KilA-N domain